MKRLLLAACLLWMVAAHADLVIVQKVESKGQSGDMTLTMKDSKSRADISPAVSMITDKDTGDMITLMHSKKLFMRIPGAATKALIEQARKATPGADSPPKLTPTGRKEKINGYETEEYSANIGQVKVSYWIARNYPGYADILAQMMKFQRGSLSAITRGMAPAAEDFPGMPIRTEMESEGLKTTTTVVSISQAPVDSKNFEIPADYKELPMPSFNTPAQ